jgi:hypothetical protein
MAHTEDRCDLYAVASFRLCDGIGYGWGGSLVGGGSELRVRFVVWRLQPDLVPIRSGGSGTDQMSQALINAYC